MLVPHPHHSSTGAVGFLLYFIVAEASLLPSAGKGRDIQKVTGGAAAVGNMVWNTYRAVHMTIGLVIMVPILLVAFFPFMTHFQVCFCDQLALAFVLVRAMQPRYWP